MSAGLLLQEQIHVHGQGWASPPPAPPPTGSRVALKQLWSLLPESARRQTTHCLGQALIRRMLQSRIGREVQHDRE